MGTMYDIINNQMNLKQSLERGVTYWDTADCYEGGRSRKRHRQVLHQPSRSPQGNFPRHEIRRARSRGHVQPARAIDGAHEDRHHRSLFRPRHRKHRRAERRHQGMGAPDEEGRQDQALRIQHAQEHGVLPDGRVEARVDRRDHVFLQFQVDEQRRHESRGGRVHGGGHRPDRHEDAGRRLAADREREPRSTWRRRSSTKGFRTRRPS